MSDDSVCRMGPDLDEFDDYLSEAMRDPEFAGAFEDARAVHRVLDDLIACRRGAGLSRRQVAVRMGVTKAAVSRLELEPSDPRLSDLQRYARAVGVQVTVDLVSP